MWVSVVWTTRSPCRSVASTMPSAAGFRSFSRMERLESPFRCRSYSIFNLPPGQSTPYEQLRRRIEVSTSATASSSDFDKQWSSSSLFQVIVG